jgi:uncharacterized pyridoxamine 5'-phosphate oxidase family protein
MNDQIEIKDLDQEIPLQEDWLVFQKDSNRIVYKAPKSDIEGEDAFVYIGYADDDIGTGFTLTFNANKDYIAIKSTNTEIANPVVGDFAGLWKNYKGQKGDTGDTGAKPISVAFSGNNMVFVLEDSSTITLTNAKIDLKGDKGDTGKGITSIVKTGTLGLVDTYTITYSDTTTSTFDVTNGAKGDKGDKGDIGPQGIQGIQGIQGNPGTNGIDGTDGISFTPKGAYNALTEYVANDVVSYLGSTWIALQTTTGNTPEEGAYWTLNAAKGADGEGSGDMLASVYDPANVADDAFDMDNMVEGTNNKLVSAAEKSGWSGKQDALGFTPEDVANKKTTMTGNTTSDTFYLTAKAIYDWATGLFQTLANKVTSFQVTPDDAHYPSEKLVNDSLNAKANANNVLTLDNTTAFTPDNDYEPATKKYVDDNAVGTKAVFEDETITPTHFAWDLSTASYDSVSFSVSSQDTAPLGVTFKSDGTKMYMLGQANKKVYQYTLSTAWNLSTASYDSVEFSVSSQDTSPYGVTFKSDGTKMYIIGNSGKKVYQYSLSTAWDLSTASYDSVSFSVSSQDTAPLGVTFKSDGTKMYIMGNSGKKVYQYSLSTAWNLSTASYDSVNFSVSSQETNPYGVTFKSDGTKMYIVGGASDKVYQYTLSTAWNLSTASYDSVSFSVSSQDTDPYGVTFKSDGTKMYIVGITNDKVYQYTTGYDLSFAEIDTDTYGEYYLTAIADDTKISITGTPTLGQTLFVGLKDSGSAKKLTWDEINALGVTLPTQTTAGKQHIIEIKYIGSAWRAISVGKEN